MTRIANAGNVLVPTILALEHEGFVLTREPTDLGEIWTARRDDLELVADDPIQLLGLSRLHALRGNNWPATDLQIQDVSARYELDAP